MSDIYQQKIILRSNDVTMDRNLKTSRLFEWLQEVSIRHTEELGVGRKVTLDQGLLWVVTMQHAVINRMPVFDEEITIKSWPGNTMHLLFSRYYTITSSSGEELVHASAIWMLVDQNTRKAVFPEAYGITIQGVSTGEETKLPTLLKDHTIDYSFEFQVLFSYVDLNRHMNNSRYFDVVEDHVVPYRTNRIPARIDIEYQAELCHEDKVKIGWSQTKNQFFICGTGSKKYFKMEIEYR